MKKLYLEVTFRRGQAIAGYLYLPRQTTDKVHKTSREHPGIVIDFNDTGKPIGIEITAPAHTTLSTINSILMKYGIPQITDEEVAPLRAA